MSDYLDFKALRAQVAVDVAAALDAALVDGALDAAVAVVTEPRDLNPPAVLIGVPAFTVEAVRTWRVAIPVHVCAVPPGHGDALDWMLDVVSVIGSRVRPIDGFRAGPYDLNDR